MNVKEYVEWRRDSYRDHHMLGDFPASDPIRMADIFEWVLKHGEVFTGNDIETAQAVVEASYRTPELKACYNNTLLVRGSMNGLSYYEGWAFMVIPVEHAWNMRDGRVVDVTMTLPEHMESSLKDEETREYFGVEIPWEWVTKHIGVATHFRMADTGGPFLFDYALERIQEEQEEE